MNIEELKMILETINATTGLAKEMGTTWIWLHYGLQFLNGLGVFIGVVIGIYAICRTVLATNSGSQDTLFMRECRDKLNIGTSGCVTEFEYRKTTAKIMELIEKHNIKS